MPVHAIMMLRKEGHTAIVRIRDYVGTYATNAVMVVCVIFLYRLAHVYFSSTGFAEYSLLRRTYSFLFPVLSVGVAVALPRYAAAALTGDDPHRHIRYFVATIQIFAVVFAAYCVVAWFFRDEMAGLFLGSRSNVHLLDSLLPLIAGSLLHTAVHSYLRGSLRIGMSNCLMIAGMGIVPLLAFLFADDVCGVFRWTGYGTLVIGLSVTAWLLFREKAEFHAGTRSACRDLLTYGLPRVPGDIAFYGLMLLPATLTAHYYGMYHAGLVAFSLTLINMLRQLVAPISTLLLPEASIMISRRDYKRLASKTTKLLVATIPLSCLAVFVYCLFAKPILTLYLGEPDADLIRITQLVMPVAIPMNVFILLRSIVDAAYKTPINALSACFSVLLFVVASIGAHVLNGGVTGILASFHASVICLAILTAYFAFKVLTTSGNTADDIQDSAGRPLRLAQEESHG